VVVKELSLQSNHIWTKAFVLSAKHKNKEGEVCHGKDVGCSRFPTIRWYEGSFNGVAKARLIPYSSNGSSQSAC